MRVTAVIATRSAAVMLLCFAGCAQAQLSITTLDRLPPDARALSLSETPDGKVLLHAGGVDRDAMLAGKPGSLPFAPWRHWFYTLAPDGRMLRRLDLSSPDFSTIVPFGQRFAAVRLSAAGPCPLPCARSPWLYQIVAFEPSAHQDHRVMYQAADDAGEVHLFAGPGMQDLYALEKHMRGFTVLRINAAGKVVWQKETAPGVAHALSTTDNGVAFVQTAPEPVPWYVLTAYDSSGRMRWQSPLPPGVDGEVVYSPSGFLGVYEQLRDRFRVVLFDARSGRMTADAEVPSFSAAQGTTDGILLTGGMLGQSFVAMLGADGRVSWLRRYVSDETRNDLPLGLISRDHKLMLVKRSQAPAVEPTPTSIIVADRTAESIQAEWGYCLDARWSRGVELERQLTSHGISVATPKQDAPNASRACSIPTETQYLAFVEQLNSMLPPADAAPESRREVIVVRLVEPGLPIRLERYGIEFKRYPSSGSLIFSVPHDDAKEFAKALTTVISPHLQRMRGLSEEFVRLTSFQYAISNGPAEDYAKVFAALERAAQVVQTRIESIAPSTLEEIRKTGPLGWVTIVLQTDGFGPGTNMLAPESADKTFLQIVEQNRKDAKAGRIRILD